MQKEPIVALPKRYPHVEIRAEVPRDRVEDNADFIFSGLILLF